MKKSSIIIQIAVVILLISSMFLLREVPVLSPWKNWKVLSVDKSISEQKVLTELKKLSIEEVVSESSQRISLYTQLAPVLPSEFNFYKDNLYRYFYDKNHEFRLYYFPDSVSNKTLKALPFDYNIDLQSSFPYFSLIITVVAYILLLFLLKNKFLFAITLLPCILFAVVFPNFSSLVINLFFFVFIYFFDKYHERKNILSALIKNTFVMISAIACFAACFFSSFKGILLFLITILSCFGIYNVFSTLSLNSKTKKQKFDFVKIVSANNLNFSDNKTSFIFFALSFFIILGGLGYFFIPSVTNKTGDSSPLYIPTPLEYNGTRGFSLSSYTNLQAKKSPTDFPDLGDFISQVWNATVFPYIPLQNNKGYVSNVTPETSVNKTEYFEENGTIKTKFVEVARFNKQFIDETLQQIQTSQNPVIEKVLMDQESFCATDFGNVKRTTHLTYILFIVAMLFCSTQIFVFFKFYKLG